MDPFERRHEAKVGRRTGQRLGVSRLLALRDRAFPDGGMSAAGTVPLDQDILS